MPAFPTPNRGKRWFLLLGILLFGAVAAEMGILYKNNKLQSLGQIFSNRGIDTQNLSSENNSVSRDYVIAFSPTPQASQTVTSLPLSTPSHSGAVIIYTKPDGEAAWREGMFFYHIASGGATGKNMVAPNTVSGIVQNVSGDVFTIGPVPEIKKDYAGSPPVVKVKTLPSATFWIPTYSQKSGVLATITSKKEIALKDIEIGDLLTFFNLGVSGGIYTSTQAYVSF